MIKRTMIATGVALAITTTLTANIALAEEESSFMDELEISGELKNESAVFTKSGQTIGQATSTTDTTTNNSSGDLYKSENTARFFINGDVGEEGSSFHAELNLKYDTEATDGYKGAKSYSQHDLLRELYVDTEVGNEDNPISIRAGKQQVVWGTADGMKLLDAINPTDYSEMAQNQMEDSRIPVWMINAETDLPAGGNVQMVVSQAKGSVFAGLGKASGAGITNHSADNADFGHAFKMKGVDSITGKVNGFLNIAPALGAVATSAFGGMHRTGETTGSLEFGFEGAGLTVWDYTNSNAYSNFGDGTSWSGLCTNANTTNAALTLGYGGNNNGVTNLCDATQTGAAENNPNATFEYMSATSFATFDTLGAIKSEYRVEHPSGFDSNINLRLKNSTKNGLNYSLNYMNGHDTNPSVDMHWEKANGNKLYVGTTLADDASDNIGATVVGAKTQVTTVRLYDSEADATSDTNRFNAADDGGVANLVFVETLNKIQQLGGSFDMAVETAALGPVVIRGEALYQKDVESPVIDRKKLGHGDLVGGLTMVEGDTFKYVLGADITVMTNMMVSAQLIQERNLDYIDEAQTVNSEYGANHGRYTADRAAMHLSNGLQKAEENKEFYSLFLSKPFGASAEHRWNNIFMFEENGGKWNRADVEYSFSDEIIGSAEYNKYWGDENTQFGQMAKSSNFQLGLKYIF